MLLLITKLLTMVEGLKDGEEEEILQAKTYLVTLCLVDVEPKSTQYVVRIYLTHSITHVKATMDVEGTMMDADLWDIMT